MEKGENGKFYHIYSCDLDICLQLKIGTIEGNFAKNFFVKKFNNEISDPDYIYDENISELYLSAQIFSKGKEISLISTTSYKTYLNRWSWNEIIVLPLYYSHIPEDAEIDFKIWDCNGPFSDILLGETSASIFEKNGLLQQGILDLKLNMGSSSSVKNDHSLINSNQLSEIKKKYRDKDFPKVEWLDRLTFREIEILNEREKRLSDDIYLVVEFPPFTCDGKPIAVVYYDKGPDISYQIKNPNIVLFPDPQIGKENLSEAKHHALTRGPHNISSDHDLKPSTVVRDKLIHIMAYPPFTELTFEEQDLVWKYRYYLKHQNKALSKFLKSVKWDNPVESEQAMHLMNEWQPMDVEDALELLTPRFTMRAVRRYAISRLRKSKDEDLFLYLLQLVQALRYESLPDIKRGLAPAPPQTSDVGSRDLPCDTSARGALGSQEGDDDLTSFLVDRAARNSTLANYFYWFLHVECEEHRIAAKLNQNRATHPQLQQPSAHLPRSPSKTATGAKVPGTSPTIRTDDDCDQPIGQARGHVVIGDGAGLDEDGNKSEPSPWTHRINNSESQVAEIYLTVMKRFHQALSFGGPQGLLRRSLLSKQQYFIDKLVGLVKIVGKENSNRKKKVERLQALLSESNEHTKQINFSNFDPLPLPLDPEITVVGIIPDQTIIFKSALMPCKFTFRTIDKGEYNLIFKHGDDLRQDQLILQIIKLMDKLLRQENLDLKLTAYRVLATSTRHGLVQFIESHSIAEILANQGSIQNYFRHYAPSEKGPCGIKREVMDNYIKSCAGYCVITYILGIGDRHFDNLLITKSGKLFHIDFGYILGRDPKPMPPPMKLSKEMVEGMGGINSHHYQDFKKLCYTAFLHLRRHANLIMNLFSLMADANIPDIALEPDKTAKKVYEKFRLDLTDEEAVCYMQNLIDISVTAVMAALVEQIHKIAQYWRK